ncbi:MAG: GerMN domain-containing protein [Patescibacteria group bacterium]|jgi:spore germination protein GerM
MKKNILIFLLSAVIIVLAVFGFNYYKKPVNENLNVNNNVNDNGNQVKKLATDLTVKVFLGNEQFNPNAMDCSLVYPVERKVAVTPAIARAALNSLLLGPSNTEKQNGYYTSLNTGVSINSLKIENKTAYVDFDNQLEQGVGGSCRVLAIASQIRATLMQFDTVENVVISIDGRTEDILQP